MFIGHYAVGLAAKRIAPRSSLAALFMAAVLVDLIWPTLLLIGIERARIDTSLGGMTPIVFSHYPWTHSLLATAGWAALLAAVYFIAKRDRRGAFVIAALVVSHWLLDAIVHRPDLLLMPGGHWAIGFGLWRTPIATLIVELGMFAFGLMLYLRATTGVRRWPLWGLAAFLVAIYLGSVFGPPPPSIEAIAWVGQAQWLIVLAAFAVDRQPAPRLAAA